MAASTRASFATRAQAWLRALLSSLFYENDVRQTAMEREMVAVFTEVFGAKNDATNDEPAARADANDNDDDFNHANDDADDDGIMSLADVVAEQKCTTYPAEEYAPVSEAQDSPPETGVGSSCVQVYD